MRVFIAPDSFKGSVSARDAAGAIADGWRDARPDDTVVLLPMADGGEGTLDALESMQAGASVGAVRSTTPVRGPQSAQVNADWLMLNDCTAVVELAQSSGLPLMTQLDPLGAHTFGVGETIAIALDAGAERIIVGLGGSASTDGGVGALTALGAVFLDSRGRRLALGGAALAELDRVVLDDLRAIPTQGVLCLSDVTSPLFGANGAAAVFGPQKGASPKHVQALDAGLRRLGAVLGDSGHQPGDGAAGGTGFGLRTLWGAEMRSGAEEIAALAGLAGELSSTDVLVTGEGRFDHTSLQGKVVGHLLELAESRGARVAIVAGQVDDPRQDSSRSQLVTLTLTDLAGSSAAAIADPARWLRVAGCQLAQQLR